MARIEQNKVKMGWSFMLMILLFVAMCALAVQGCSTINGIGDDLQRMTSDYVQVREGNR